LRIKAPVFKREGKENSTAFIPSDKQLKVPLTLHPLLYRMKLQTLIPQDML